MVKPSEAIQKVSVFLPALVATNHQKKRLSDVWKLLDLSNPKNEKEAVFADYMSYIRMLRGETLPSALQKVKILVPRILKMPSGQYAGPGVFSALFLHIQPVLTGLVSKAEESDPLVVLEMRNLLSRTFDSGINLWSDMSLYQRSHCYNYYGYDIAILDYLSKKEKSSGMQYLFESIKIERSNPATALDGQNAKTLTHFFGNTMEAITLFSYDNVSIRRAANLANVDGSLSLDEEYQLS